MPSPIRILTLAALLAPLFAPAPAAAAPAAPAPLQQLRI